MYHIPPLFTTYFLYSILANDFLPKIENFIKIVDRFYESALF
jgi:hypothetical protein